MRNQTRGACDLDSLAAGECPEAAPGLQTWAAAQLDWGKEEVRWVPGVLTFSARRERGVFRVAGLHLAGKTGWATRSSGGCRQRMCRKLTVHPARPLTGSACAAGSPCRRQEPLDGAPSRHTQSLHCRFTCKTPFPLLPCLCRH